MFNMNSFKNPLVGERLDDHRVTSQSKKWAIISVVALFVALVSVFMMTALFVKFNDLRKTQQNENEKLREKSVNLTSGLQKVVSLYNDLNMTMDNETKAILDAHNNDINTILLVVGDMYAEIAKSRKAEEDGKIPKYEGGNCTVGMADGRVKDTDITASSSYGPDSVPSYGRLDLTGSRYSFWHALYAAPGEWIQVDLTSPTKVTGVVTQGRPNSLNHDWVTSYKISYGNSTDNLQVIQSQNGIDTIFPANSDWNTHVTNILPEPIVARFFRLSPQSWSRVIALRLEYLTC